MPEDRYKSFLNGATILLSAMVGILIIYPLALARLSPAGSPSSGYGMLLLGAAGGALLGYRRRNSRIFLYFCMLAIIILAIVISSSIEG